MSSSRPSGSPTRTPSSRRSTGKPPLAGSSGREAALFVHGFNTNFAEGVYRQAQLSHDHDVEGPSIHFAWPSAAITADYAYDRESALFSRDGLEAAIEALARANVASYNLVAHSMGRIHC
jgi:esterase/lipase superfamily enzyme